MGENGATKRVLRGAARSLFGKEINSRKTLRRMKS
jgi:hypothetical protein